MLPVHDHGGVLRPAPSTLLETTKVVAVLRAAHAREYAPVIEALERGGVRSVELTLSTAGTFEELPVLLERFGSALEIGVGTVTSVQDAEAALDRGAAFIVTPTTDPAVVTTCTRRAVPVYPGGLTPTELHTGWKAGATAVKVFPASVVGPGYLAQLRGPFPDLEIVPSGGVSIDDAPAWITAGALAVSLGGPLLGDAFAEGNLADLTTRARRVRTLVDQAREDR